MSSMSPTIVLKDGKPFLAIGSPGGSKIVGTVLNVLVAVLHWDLGLRDAIDRPRVVSRNSPTLLEAELFHDDELLRSLHEMGYEVTGDFGPRPLGFVQAAMRNTTSGDFIGAADTKRLSVSSALAF